ncbi:MAG: hypothetical protein K2X43_07020 [Hyphomonadaceae bacterium]|jgi:hypothetical protein|nr:hypothetical protein [Hyphomonadaceae bacterium]
MHGSQQFTPPQLLEAGRRAEVDGRLDLAAQFYRHLTEHFAFTGEAAEARNGLGRVGAAQSQSWYGNGAAHATSPARLLRRRPIALRDHYRTGRWLAMLVSALGWVITLGGVVLLPSYVGLSGLMPSASMPRPGMLQILAGAIGMIAAGLFIVFSGQIARALFDQANAVRDLVALERAKLGSD